MEEYTVERELDLKDLFWSIVRRWRMLIVWALIGMIVLGAVGYWKNSKLNRIVSDREDLVTSMEPEEVRDVTEAVNLYRQVKTLEADIEADPILSMNPYEMTQVILLYYIDAENVVDGNGAILQSFNGDLMAAYSSKIFSDESRETLAEFLGVSDEQISSYVNVIGTGSSSLQVTLIGDQDDACNQMADYIDETLKKYTPVFREEIGEHELSLISRNTEVGYVSSIDNQRVVRKNSLSSLQETLKSKVASLSTTQQTLYNNDIATIEGKFSENQTASVIFLLIGAFAGGFLACVWIVLVYLLNGKVKTEDDLKQLLGMKYLTSVNGPHKKKFLSGIDQLILRLENGEDQLPQKEELRMVASNITMLCKKAGVKKALLTGTRIRESGTELMNSLVKELKEQGIETELGVSVLYNAVSFEKMVEFGQVILWETVEDSKFEKVQQLVSLCRMQGVNILGAIVEK